MDQKGHDDENDYGENESLHVAAVSFRASASCSFSSRILSFRFFLAALPRAFLREARGRTDSLYSRLAAAISCWHSVFARLTAVLYSAGVIM